MTTVFFKFRRSVRVELINRRTVIHVERKFHSIQQAMKFLGQK